MGKINKYGNIKTVRIQSGKEKIYDSRKEAKWASDLRYLELDGQISDLKEQVAFRIEYNGLLICRYIADFVYWEKGKQIVLDVKSEFTRKDRVYRLKRKLMKAFHGIDITEAI